MRDRPMTQPAAAIAFAIGPDDAIDFDAVRRVLVIMLRHHGDVLLSTPVYAALKASYPHAEVDALIYAETLPILAFSPHLAAIHTIDRRWKNGGARMHVAHEWRLLQMLRARGYDLIVHLTDHKRGAWLARALAPRWAVAPKLRDASGTMQHFWRGSFTHLYANASSVAPGAALARRHTVEQNLDALRRLGLAISPGPPLTMVPGPEGERDAQALRDRLGLSGRYIAMQPTSRWMFKCWTVDRNADLIAALLRRGETVLLSCAPDARERAMLAAIVAALRTRPHVQIERLKIADDDGTLNRLAVLIGGARLFIGIDSAPMHIAAAMGTPTVALFGPSGEFNWGPWQVAHRIVTSEMHPCRPCGQDGCGGGKISDCLVRLPVARVLAAIDALLAECADADDVLRDA